MGGAHRSRSRHHLLPAFSRPRAGHDRRRQSSSGAGMKTDLGLPAERNAYHVEAGVRVPTRDGETLLSDHYVPDTGEPRGTILIRSSYGRSAPYSSLLAEPYAARGYHVLMQSVRGTVGSTGTFEPMVNESADALDTLEWLRAQDWFDGRLGTIGASYLGFTQYGLMLHAPDELKASVVMMAPHHFGEAIYARGMFALETFLGWSNSAGLLASGLAGAEMVELAMSIQDKLTGVMTGLPMTEAAESLIGGLAPWYREWLLHPDLSDEFWSGYDFTAALYRTQASVLLIGGWSDMFLDQMATQYAVLHGRGLDVAMTLGDWKHTDTLSVGAPEIHQQALAWFDQHVAGAEPSRRTKPVRVQLVGPGEWVDLDEWPPRTTEIMFALGTDLIGERTTFGYHPDDPTPSFGGRAMTATGHVDNAELEARPDVLTFTSAPLDTQVDVIGTPTVELVLAVDNPYSDVFVRICDVDRSGVSVNVTDVIRRLDASVPAGNPQRLQLSLDPCAYRIEAGHRVRLQVSGAAHPRHARNLGVAGRQTTSTELMPSVHSITLEGSKVILPVY
ncbi:CocE/NonD family hydrolase [Kribbella sp. DT2]|uniref:CocE/NonD family hydrolase n=1 Tax=Kribbella sp. DT2 TaxID=3393427 RepID=UPI003CEEF947